MGTATVEGQYKSGEEPTVQHQVEHQRRNDGIDAGRLADFEIVEGLISLYKLVLLAMGGSSD